MLFSVKNSIRSIRALRILPIFVVLSFAGCSTYQNVTGYFNTYYNAKKLFDEAEGEVLRTPQKDLDTNYFAIINIQAATQAKFDKVIEKCSKLIQFYPQSSWVDDGILMIEKSYVYLGEYESAIRKYKELQDNFPGTDLRFEAKFWCAKAEYDVKKDDEALRILKELFPEARAEGRDNIILLTLMLQAEIFSERNEYDQAAASYALALEVPGDDAIRSFAQFQLAGCFEKSGDRSKAASAYARVKEYTSDPTMLFRARLRYGMMLTAMGEYDRALKSLDDLNDEQLRPEEHGLVDLEIANTYRIQGDTAQAFPLYTMIDTMYRRTDAAARSLYQRGLYYEDVLIDYKTSRDYFTRAKTEFPASEITPLAQRHADNLDRYFTSKDNLKKYGAMYEQALHHDSTNGNQGQPGSDSTGGISRLEVNPARGADSTLASQRPGGDEGARSPFKPPDLLKESLRPPPETMQQGVSQSLRRRFADRDSVVDDDEEESAPDRRSSFASTPGSRRDSMTVFTRRDSLNQSRPALPAGPQAVLTPDSIQTLIAQTHLEIAGLYYLALNQPDSAIVWYQRVIDDYSTAQRVVPRALYALAEIYGTRHDSAAVDSLYQWILDEYGNSEYGTEVKKILGLEITPPVQSDSTAVKYGQAENLLESGDSIRALRLFKRIARSSSHSELVSRAQYAVGWIYESVLFNNDSAAAWYTRLLKDYPASVYAQNVQPKIAVRKDPNSLKEYIKIKELETPGQPADTTHRRKTAAERILEQNEKIQQGRDSDEQDDNPIDDSDEPDDSDDDNNNM
jgi:tetratricopeptide (TPR) repeat protein